VARHSPRYRSLNPGAPLSVGNGEFCFTADVTGLQTFPDAHPGGSEGDISPGTLLGTMAQWGWHSTPAPSYDLRESQRMYDTPHGRVPYVDLTTTSAIHNQYGATPAEEWLRNNPHRLDLGRIGLWTPGILADVGSIDDIDQHLDLLTGILTSKFRLGSRSFTVNTAAHPRRDAVAILIETDDDERVGIRIRFSYGSEAWGNAADWSRPDHHQSEAVTAADGWLVDRQVDDTTYQARITAGSATLDRVGDHEYVVSARGSLAVTVEFTSNRARSEPLQAAVVHKNSTLHWNRFWSTGAAIDFSASTDPRAVELERRVVLSQYLTAIQCAGSTPPAETGLTANSWRGKFHLEMHWWHAAHFALWDRVELLERSLPWYESILDRSRATAREQGLRGARWPKQVGPEGREAPSSIGPFLVWQQPHPIHLAELVYRARRDRATLERWASIVFATAEFMAAFASASPAGFALGPPLIPAQESYAVDRAAGKNPTFELAYWSWALEIASKWRERLGLPPEPQWRRVARGMAAPPQAEGRYLALETPPGLVREDHPSLLFGLGLVPETQVIDVDVMRRTLDDVLRDWDWDSTWGWDFPAVAMTATRLGRPDIAVDSLMMERPKNTFLSNGHNWQTSALPLYLPGNGSLLVAVAIMAGGYDGSAPVPGFPRGWNVAAEGFVPAPR
jgi:hypothetical protein